MTISTTTGEEPSPPTTSPQNSVASRNKRYDRVLEIIAVVLLGISTIATSWSGYQATRWGGVQSTSYSQASGMRVESTRASTAAGQQRTIDIVLFGNWLAAYADNNEELADFYESRFRQEFLPAFEAWIASQPLQNADAKLSPFDQPEYVQAAEVQAQEFDDLAAATFIKGQQANQQSDDYVLNAVLLASVLFLAGIAQRFNILSIRVLIIVIAAAMCLFGLFKILTYPIA